MKKKIVLSLITICILSFASCGNNTTETSETTVTAETTVEATPEPTAKPEPAFTPEAETTPEATESKAEINENDSQTSEGEAIEEEVVATPTPAPTTTTGYVLEEDTKEYLKGLGATDSDLANVKSDDDLATLITKLFGGGSSSTGNSGSTAGGGSSSADTGSSGATGEDVRDPSRDFQLGSGDTVQGSM